MVRMVDFKWPFFQPTIRNEFARIYDNNMLHSNHIYLLRDRRIGLPKMDYIVRYDQEFRDYHILVEPFRALFYKPSDQSKWTIMSEHMPFVQLFHNFRLFDMYGKILISKSMINNRFIDPEKSATIYHLFEIENYEFNVPPEKIKPMIEFIINRSIKVNPLVINDVPKDLLPIGVSVGGRKTKRSNRKSRRHRKTIKKDNP